MEGHQAAYTSEDQRLAEGESPVAGWPHEDEEEAEGQGEGEPGRRLDEELRHGGSPPNVSRASPPAGERGLPLITPGDALKSHGMGCQRGTAPPALASARASRGTPPGLPPRALRGKRAGPPARPPS